jgi:hypothetical protein
MSLSTVDFLWTAGITRHRRPWWTSLAVLLPSARRPNQGNRCACRDLEIEAVQNRLPVSVAKDDVVWKTGPCRQRSHVDASQLTKLDFTIHMLARHSIL